MGRAWLLVGAACGPNVDVDDASSSDTTSGEGPESGPDSGPVSVTVADTGGDDGGASVYLIDQREVDVLFVVDNTGSMGEEQAKLAAGIGALVDRLDAGGLDYRVGVTTTDNGNPWCGSTSPEGGKLIATSCRSRTGEFVFGGVPPADATALACLDQCTVDDLGILPTATEVDPQLMSRPWIERTSGVANVEGITTTEALRCMLPQGIAGCGYEQHLESMYKAILRTEVGEQPEYGFIRASAVLAVVLVSDETDCSYSNDWQSIFLPADMGGNPDVFWSDPSAASPTSAVCWNAGVACTGGPGVYDECHAENKDVDGFPAASGDDSVMRPVSRYVDLLQELEDKKREFMPGQEILVAAITGVPVGYETGAADLVYQAADDPQIQGDFGIGPGCVATDAGFGLPPVREREFAEAFMVGDQRNAYSICADDFAPALDAIGVAIRDQMRPPCFPACAADTNPVTTDLDPVCTIVQESPSPNGGIDEVDVPPCVGGAVPDGVDVCYETLSGEALSPFCANEGWNLEFRFVRREGVAAPSGAGFRATCQLSQQKAIDCPDLP